MTFESCIVLMRVWNPKTTHNKVKEIAYIFVLNLVHNFSKLLKTMFVNDAILI